LTLIKSTVGCLALVNIVYYLWAHGVAQSQEPVAEMPVANSLKLLSEVPESERAAAGAQASGVAGSTSAAPADTATTAASSRRCISLGPFREMADAVHTANTLRSGGYDPRQRVADGDVWAGVWVYLPVPASPAASEQLLAKLKAAGIDDALEMPGPAEGSVVSLGLYSEQKRAQARVAQAQALGLSPALADRKRTGDVYWLDVDLKPTESALNPTNLPGEGGRISRIESKPCPTGAPP
jgi:hypothetical protein